MNKGGDTGGSSMTVLINALASHGAKKNRELFFTSTSNSGPLPLLSLPVKFLGQLLSSAFRQNEVSVKDLVRVRICSLSALLRLTPCLDKIITSKDEREFGNCKALTNL